MWQKRCRCEGQTEKRRITTAKSLARVAYYEIFSIEKQSNHRGFSRFYISTVAESTSSVLMWKRVEFGTML